MPSRMPRGNMLCSTLVLLLVLVCTTGVTTDGFEVVIGVVAQEPDEGAMLEAAARAAVRAATQELDCPKFSVYRAPVEPDEPLAVPDAVCSLAKLGASWLVVSGHETSVRLGAAGAARCGVPLLLVQPAPPLHAAEALSMYPHVDVLAQACGALCKAKGWQRAVLLHEGAPSAAALLAPSDDSLSLLARHLPPPEDIALLRNLMMVLKKSGAVNFIVWCDAQCCVRALSTAQQVGLLADRHSYILLSLDLHTEDLEPYSHGGANITAFQLFEQSNLKNLTSQWYQEFLNVNGDEAKHQAVEVRDAAPTALVLAYEATSIAVRATCSLRLPEVTQGPAGNGDCAAGRAALQAGTLLNYMRSSEVWGVESSVSWDAEGTRREVGLGVAELSRDAGGRLAAVGRWTPRAGLAWNRRDVVSAPPRVGMTNRTFTFLIAESKPYIMRKESEFRLAGNERFEGFCIELVQRLAEQLGFNYTFEVHVGGYGTRNNVTKQWDGMMKRLMEEPEIDFAITDLSITAEREQAVDFTTPFMNLGISILFTTPTPPKPDTFAFLLPFSKGVWFSLGAAFILTSLVLYVVGRLCPEEWQNPYPCIEEPDVLENQFTLANAFWFNTGAVLLQGSEIAPVAYGTRSVASMWWLFALVITSSYTANLATLLAKKTTTELIHDAEELANNDIGITYGAKAGGSTYTFFQNSKNELYQKMYEHMKNQKMPISNDEGIEKVMLMKGKYAFLMESTSIEYTVQRNCEVKQVGGLLDSKGYAIAMKKNESYAAYRQALNLALLSMQESGELRRMKYEWWEEKHGGGACEEEEEHENDDLGMDNVLGLFYVLVVGSALGVVWSCVDLALAAARRPHAMGEPYGRRLWAELRLVFRFEQSWKPSQGPPLESPATSAHDTAAACCGASRRSGSAPRSLGSASRSLGSARRRRSSLHAASLRLARHARRSSDRGRGSADDTDTRRNPS